MKNLTEKLDKVASTLDYLGLPHLSSELDVISNTLEKMAMTPETEAERLMKKVLPGTPFAGIAKAVGGYVRDEYLSLLKGETPNPKDLDVVVGGPAGGGEKLSKFIHEKFPEQTYVPRNMGKGYPIWQLVFFADIPYEGETYETNGAVIEFADAMQERFPDPNSRQREVMHATIEEDNKRRDFTVNMLLKDLTTGEIEDLTGRSKKDIEEGILTGHPDVPLDQMFNDDPLRMIRLVRFNAKYGWKVPREVIRAVQRNADRIKIVSQERILPEMEKILKLGKLHQAVKFMAICGLLPHLLPEIQALKGVAQDSRHHDEGDVYRHTMLVLKNAPMTPEGQLAALLHDVGKPSSQKFIGDKIQFLGHEEVGAEMAEAILKRLRFGSDVVDKVTRVVRQHMRPHWTSSPEVSEKAIRKFIVDMGQDLEAVLAQAVADRKGMLPYVDDAEQLVKKVTDIKEKDKNLGVQGDKLPLTGFEIMDALGIPKGPKVGEAVRLLQDIQNEYLSNGKPLDKDSAVIELRRRFPSDASVS